MRRSRRHQPLASEEPRATDIPDQITGNICRLCLKCKADNLVSLSDAHQKMLEGLSSTPTKPVIAANDKICNSCLYQLEASSEFMKKVDFTNILWRSLRKQMAPATVSIDLVAPQSAGLFHCHLCTIPFVYESLLSHITLYHGPDHVSECKLCGSLINWNVPSDITNVGSPITNNEKEMILEKSPRKRKVNRTPTEIRKIPNIGNVPNKSPRAPPSDHPTEEEKPYRNLKGAPLRRSCKECNICFDTQGLFIDHLKTEHDISDVIYDPPVKVSSKDTAQKPFCCHICEFATHGRDKLAVHLRAKHKVVLLKRVRSVEDSTCKICGKVLSVPKALRRHMKVHGVSEVEIREEMEESNSQYVCPTCAFKCRTALTFKKHLQSHYPLPYCCSVCKVVSFDNRGERKEHEIYCGHLSFSKSITYECVPCGEIIIGVEQLKEHQLQKHPVDEGHDNGMRFKYHCCICEAAMEKLQDMENHLNEHGNMECARCEKSYSSTHQLRDHFRITHNHSKSLVCIECGQVLSRPDKLLEHMWTHTGFICNVCKVVFATRKDAQKHRRENHPKMSRKSESQRGRLNDIEIIIEGDDRIIIEEESVIMTDN